MQTVPEHPEMKIINMKPLFPKEETKERKQKEIELQLYQVFSKYFEKKA